MKKAALILLMIVLLLGGYRFFIAIQFERQTDRFVQNQQGRPFSITADTVTSANSLFTIGRHYENMRIETSELTYQNPDVYLFVSIFHPLTVQIRMQGLHHLNGTEITSSTLTGSVHLKDQTGHAAVKNIHTPLGEIDSVSLDFAWHKTDLRLQPLWIQIQKTVLAVTGNLSDTRADLSATLVGWKDGLAYLKEKHLLSKDGYNQLYWTFQLLSNGNELVIPVTIQNNRISVAGIQWTL